MAFCEAGDYADEADTITLEELAVLEITTPSGRILANYNKKKDKANNPADPDMPCILVDEPCPCWTAVELMSVADGVLPFSGAPAESVYCYATPLAVLTGGEGDVRMWDSGRVEGVLEQQYAQVWDDSLVRKCQYQEFDEAVGTVVVRNASVLAGTLTLGQHANCVDEMVERWHATSSCTVGNHP